LGLIQDIFNKIKYGQPVILVSGLPRSGTSMMMKMLDAGGLDIVTDKIRQADDDNPKGYFEFEKVKDLDKPGDKSWMKDLRGKAVKIISFLIKDLPSDCRYKIIFVMRNLDEIIASQNKMLENRGEDYDPAEGQKMKANYDRHLRKVKYEMNHAGNIRVLYIGHREVIDNPEDSARKINRFLGGNLDVKKMAEAVDPDLYRNRAA
jgi:ElaB/YqjD/DUF883 family membrane-anchored ribosome-binding protein